MFRPWQFQAKTSPINSRIVTALLSLGLLVIGITGLMPTSVAAAPSPGINNQINYQGRLLNAAGAVVPDGVYNMQFKLYKNGDGLAATDNTCTITDCASTTGTLLWTEEWLGQASHGITIKNGYFSVSLGSITTLVGVDFNQPVMWLSMNIAGGANTTSATCTPFSSCTPDGEMLPMRRLASSVYALQAGSCTTCILQAPTSTAQNTIAPSTNSVTALTVTGTSGTAATAVSITQAGAADNLDLTNTGATSQSFLKVTHSGSAFTGTAILVNVAAGSGTFASGAFLDLQANGASKFKVDNLGAVTLAGAQAADITTLAGTAPTALVFQPGNNTTATSAGAGLTLSAGNDSGATASTGGLLTLKGGNATGGGQTGGGVTIDSGTGTAGGAINIGPTNATSISLGQTTTVATGKNFSLAGGQVTINAGSSASALVVNGSSTAVLTVDTSANRVTVGAVGGCTGGSGKLCVATNAITGGGGITNAANVLTLNGTTAGTNYGQRILLTDTNTAVADTNYALFVDTTGTNNASAITNGIFVNSPTGLGGGNLIQLQAGANSALSVSNAGVATLGAASGLTGKLTFANATNANAATLQGNTAATASYTTVLPAAVGSAGQCLSLASVVTTTQTLGYSSCGGGGAYVTLQGATPGTADVGNLNINGTGIFGSGSNQIQLIVKANASQTNANPLVELQTSAGAELLRVNSLENTSAFVGYLAGSSATNTGTSNTGVGSSALAANTNASDNTALGYQSLQVATTGGKNTAVGSGTLGANISGAGNSAFGYQALINNTAANNTGIGFQSLGLTTSSNNTGVGYKAFRDNTTGQYNSALGYSAGFQDSGGNFVSGAALQNATAIGAYAQVQATNAIVLGSIDTPTNVGIGTTVPANLLSVSPVVYSTGTAYQTTTAITGTGTSWLSSGLVKVGQQFIYSTGQVETITAVNSDTSLTASVSQTVSSTPGITYRIHTPGFNVTSAGSAFVQNASLNAFAVQAGTSTQVNFQTVAGNLIANPSFELGNYNGWSLRSGATGGIDQSNPNFGTYDFTLTTGTANGAGIQYGVGLKPSTTYSFSFYMRRDVGSTSAVNIGRADNGTDTDCVTGATITTTYTQYSCTFTTGATIGASPNVYIKQTDTTTDTFYLDGFSLVAGGTVVPYTPSATGSALQVDGTTSNVTINAGLSLDLQPWKVAQNTLPAGRSRAGIATANGYIYMVGGGTGVDGGTPTNTVYYARVNTDGSVGAWTTNTNNLGTAIQGAQATVVGNYIYLVAGSTNTGNNGAVTTVQYARLNSDGSTGTWGTTTGIPTALTNIGVTSYNGYVYAIAGDTTVSADTSAIYYGKVNGDGTISSWTTNATPLIYTTQGVQPMVLNGSLYILGGSDQVNVNIFKLNPDGSASGRLVSTTNTAALPASRGDQAQAALNGALYSLGGFTGATLLSSISFGQPENDSTFSSYPAVSNSLPTPIENGRAIALNGYLYFIGGDNNVTATSNVFYTTPARTQINGSLDLVGATNGTLTEGSGGSLTAGNTAVLGSLNVQDAASFNNLLTVNGQLTVNNAATFRNAADSTSALVVLNAAGKNVINVATSSGVLGLGTASGLTGQLLFNNATNGFTSLIQANTAASASYTSILPAAVGAAGQCLALASVVTTTQTLGYASCGGAGGANVTLSNLTGPTAINTDLTFATGTDRNLTVGTQSVAATAGNNLTISAATGNTTGAGGNLTLQGGAATATAGSNGGNVTLAGAAGTATGVGGNGGSVTISGGSAGGSAAHPGGTITLQGGSPSGAGAAGGVLVKNLTNSTTAFQVQNSNATATILAVDSSNQRVNIGTGGTPNGQIFVPGSLPATNTSSTSTGASTNPLSTAIVGKVAYVLLAGSNKLQAYDISIANAPVAIGSGVTVAASAASVVVSGSYAYVMTQTAVSGLQVINISNPYSMSVVKTVSTANGLNGGNVEGRYLYAFSFSGSTLLTYDMSNAASPILTSTVATQTGPGGMTIAGRYAYVAAFTGGKLQIFDLTAPATPVSVSITAVINGPDSVIVEGKYAYVGIYSTPGFQVYDVSNPASVPAAVGSIAVGSGVISLAMRDNLVYLAEATGLQTVDVTNPASPAIIATTGSSLSISGAASANTLAVTGRYAYVSSDSNNTFQAFDLGGIDAQTIESGSVSTSNLVVNQSASIAQSLNIGSSLNVGRNVLVAGDAAFNSSVTIASNSATALTLQNALGQQIFNFDNVGKTFSLGSTGNATGKIVFYNSTNTFYESINPSVPATTNRTITLPDASGALCLDSGNCSATGGYVLLQAASPGTQQTGNLNLNGSGIFGTSLAVGSIGTKTGQLYVSGLVPTTTLNTLSTTYTPVATAVRGHYAYVATSGTKTLRVYDISNPAAISFISSSSLVGTPTAIVIIGHYIYVSEDSSLDIFEIGSGGEVLSGTWFDLKNTINTVAGIGITALTANGSTLYATSYSGASTYIYNTINPFAPVLTSIQSSILVSANPDSLVAYGSYMFTAGDAGGGELSAYYINDMSLAASVNTGGLPAGTPGTRVAVSGRYAYVTDGATLYIIDTGNVLAMSTVGTYAAGSTILHVTVAGQYAYLALNNNTIAVVNISNVTSPTGISSVSTTTTPGQIFIQGRYLITSNTTSVVSYDLGGEYAQSLEAGSLAATSIKATTLGVLGASDIGGALNVGGGLSVTGGIHTGGPISVEASYTGPAIQVLQSDYTSLFNVDARTNTVTIGTISPPPIGVASLGAGGSLIVGDKYCYVVTGIDAAGIESGPSSPVCSYTSSGNQSITVNWTSTGAQTYRLYSNSANVAAQQFFTTTGTSYTDTGAAGTTNSPPPFNSSGNIHLSRTGITVQPYSDGQAILVTNAVGTGVFNVDTSGGILGLGSASALTGQLSFANATNAYTSLIQGNTAATASYTSILPAAVGSAGQCLALASVASTTQTLGYASCGGAGGANVTLSNLTGPTAINTDLTFASGANRTLTVGTQTVAATAGNNLTISAATGNTTGAGGTLTLQGGAATATAGSNGGGVTLAGAAGTATGTGGVGGAVTITGGNAGGSGANAGGRIILQAGSATGAGAIGGVLVKNAANSTTAFQVQNTAGISMLTVDTATTSNLITNPGFEVNTTGWALSGSATIAQNTTRTNAYNGQTSLLVTTSATGAGATVSSFTASITPAQYTFSFYAMGGTNTGTLGVTITGGTTPTCTLNQSALLTTGFQRYICNFTSTTTNVTAITIATTGGTSGTFWIDGVQLVTGATAPAYSALGALQLRGNINSPLSLQNTTNSTTALQLQNAAGTTVLSADTINQRISIGSVGTAAGQLYVGGTIPTAAMGSTSVGATLYGLYVQGRYAYVPNGNFLAIYDVSNASSPVAKGSVYMGASSSSYSLFVQGRYAYVVDQFNNSLGIYDVSNPANPTAAGSISTGTTPYGVYVQGRYAYVVNQGSNTLTLYDISNPALPLLAGTVATGASTSPSSVFVQGRYAYVANTGNATLGVFDVSNAAAPTSVGSVGTVTGPNTVYVQGRYAYVSGNNATGKLGIYDISTPTAPSSVGSITTGSFANSVYVQGHYAYVSHTTSNTIAIVDITTPAGPVILGNIPTITQNIFVQGRYLYVDSNTSLAIFDLGGSYIQQLETGGVEAGTLSVNDSAFVGGNIAITGGLTVGQSAEFNAGLSSSGNVEIQTKTNSTTAFQIQNASASPIFVVDTATTSNLISNPGFESGTSGWALSGSATIAQNLTKANAYHGAASLLVTTTATGAGAAVSTFTQSLVPAQYSFSFYAMGGTNTGALGVTITGGSAPVCTLNTTALIVTGFKRYTCTFTSTTTNITAITITTTGGANGTFYIDAVQLVQAATAAPYSASGAIQLRGAINSPVTFQSVSNSTTAFQIQNAAGSSNLLIADSINSRIGIGIQPSFTLDVNGSVNSTGGAVTLAGNAASSLTTTAGGLTIDTLTAAGQTTAIDNGNITHTILLGTGTAVQTITIGSTNTTSKTVLQGGFSTTTTGKGVIIGSDVADGNQVNLQLDTSNVFAETGSTCGTTVNQGALYYNSTTAAIRGCVNASWEDVVTTSGLGIILYGVIPDSTATAGSGDLAGAGGFNSGPCKVYVTATANIVGWNSCAAYSGGRKVLVTAGTVTVSASTTVYQNLCLTGANNQPALVGAANATETTSTLYPAFAVGSPILCLAEIKTGTSASTVAAITDTRVYTTDAKQFATLATTAPLGVLVSLNGTAGQYAPSGAAASVIGVLVTYSGTVSTTNPNAVIVTQGPISVKASAGTLNQFINSSASGVATTAAGASATAYANAGLAQTSYSASATSCAVSSACAGYVFTILDPK